MPNIGWAKNQKEASEAASKSGAEQVFTIPFPVTLEAVKEVNDEALAGGLSLIAIVVPEVSEPSGDNALGVVAGATWRLVRTNPNPQIPE